MNKLIASVLDQYEKEGGTMVNCRTGDAILPDPTSGSIACSSSSASSLFRIRLAFLGEALNFFLKTSCAVVKESGFGKSVLLLHE